jgi:hypothetical protein
LLLFSFRWFHRVLRMVPFFFVSQFTSITYQVNYFHVSCALIDSVSAFSINIHPLLGRWTIDDTLGVGWIRESNVAMLYLCSRYSTSSGGQRTPRPNFRAINNDRAPICHCETLQQQLLPSEPKTYIQTGRDCGR